MENSRNDAIKACLECHLTCQETLAYHGDEKGGRQLSHQHIKRLMACIELCQVTANMLVIRAPLIDQLSDICARVCEQCATSCETIDITSMRQCANACQRAAVALYDVSINIKRAA